MDLNLTSCALVDTKMLSKSRTRQNVTRWIKGKADPGLEQLFLDFYLRKWTLVIR